MEAWGWVGFGCFSFEILASLRMGGGRNDGLLGFLAVVVNRSPPGRVSERFGWGGGLKKVWCCY